jgi:predicted small integral membrane protein
VKGRASAFVAVLAAGVLAVAPWTAASAEPVFNVHLYFPTSSGRTLLPMERRLTIAAAGAVVAAILAGPTPAERARGAARVVAHGARLVSLQRQRGDRLFLSLRGVSLLRLSTIPRLRVIAALTLTLTSLRGIKSVRFNVDGRPWGVRDLNSRLIRDYSRATLERAMTACAPAEGCFSP